MRRIFLSLFCCFSSLVSAWESSLYCGAQQQYFRMEFDNPSYLEGFQTGVTAGVFCRHSYLFGDLNVEGNWTTGRITGDPCQRSCIEEYLAKLKLGGVFCYGNSVFIKPYLGFGYNFFSNEQDPRTAKLHYRYTKLFVPIGVDGIWRISDNVSLGLQAEWRPDVYSFVRVLSKDLSTKRSQAARVQLPVNVCFGPCACFFVRAAPFFDWNRFGEVKETKEQGIRLPIPRLIRWNLGVRVLFGYQF